MTPCYHTGINIPTATNPGSSTRTKSNRDAVIGENQVLKLHVVVVVVVVVKLVV